ncbi:hypothetical protein [Campylobacter jejuni]|uniref:hypothetical protein n=1 Tax=Campylobacter jejuni TaxID=197 RepID=UPI000D3A0F68|nr:hypothetical protein [Campylobacter jejuni]AWB41279.1 hypothetical protein CJ12664_0053 [Campylobacter jejuni]EDP6138080.1 hypothetical protein [Campylobacter jejuni]
MINGINFNLNHHHTILNLNNKKEDEKFSNNTMTENSIYRGEKFEFNSKIFGLDKSISKKDMKKFNNFMKSNALKDPNKIEKSSLKNLGKDYNSWDIKDEDIKLMNFSSYSQMFNLGSDITKKASNFRKEFNNLMQEDLTLEEFKTKYLDFKQRHDEFVKEFEIAMGDKMLLNDNNDTSIQENKETYKDDNTRNDLVKKLLEGKFSTSKELELLFGMKFSDDDAGEFNKILSLNSTPKSIDIKA